MAKPAPQAPPPAQTPVVAKPEAAPLNKTAPVNKAAPLDEAILAALTRNGAGTLSPPEIAHVIEPDGDWHALLMPIRRAAVALALDGRLVIYRKGKPVDDPSDFRGVYRLGLPKEA